MRGATATATVAAQLRAVLLQWRRTPRGVLSASSVLDEDIRVATRALPRAVVATPAPAARIDPWPRPVPQCRGRTASDTPVIAFRGSRSRGPRPAATAITCAPWERFFGQAYMAPSAPCQAPCWFRRRLSHRGRQGSPLLREQWWGAVIDEKMTFFDSNSLRVLWRACFFFLSSSFFFLHVASGCVAL